MLNVLLHGLGKIFRSSKNANLDTKNDSLPQLVAELWIFEIIHVEKTYWNPLSVQTARGENFKKSYLRHQLA